MKKNMNDYIRGARLIRRNLQGGLYYHWCFRADFAKPCVFSWRKLGCLTCLVMAARTYLRG